MCSTCSPSPVLASSANIGEVPPNPRPVAPAGVVGVGGAVGTGTVARFSFLSISSWSSRTVASLYVGRGGKGERGERKGGVRWRGGGYSGSLFYFTDICLTQHHKFGLSKSVSFRRVLDFQAQTFLAHRPKPYFWFS